MTSVARLGALVLMLASCAGAPKKQEGAPPPRIKDSAPERAAAQRAASPGLRLESEEERWGIEAAQERKRQEQENKPKAAQPDGGAGKQVTPLPAAH
jgi:hypothetical protein